MSKTQKVFADPNAQIERIKVEGQDFVLMREKVYFDMLKKIESLDSALDLQHSESEAHMNSARALLLRAGADPEVIEFVLQSSRLGHMFGLLRQCNQLNQKELARKAGVSQTTISNLENDKISFRTLSQTEKVCSALGVSHEEILRFIVGCLDKPRKKRSRDFMEVDFSSPSMKIDPAKAHEKE